MDWKRETPPTGSAEPALHGCQLPIWALGEGGWQDLLDMVDIIVMDQAEVGRCGPLTGMSDGETVSVDRRHSREDSDGIAGEGKGRRRGIGGREEIWRKDERTRELKSHDGKQQQPNDAGPPQAPRHPGTRGSGGPISIHRLTEDRPPRHA